MKRKAVAAKTICGTCMHPASTHFMAFDASATECRECYEQLKGNYRHDYDEYVMVERQECDCVGGLIAGFNCQCGHERHDARKCTGVKYQRGITRKDGTKWVKATRNFCS